MSLTPGVIRWCTYDRVFYLADEYRLCNKRIVNNSLRQWIFIRFIVSTKIGGGGGVLPMFFDIHMCRQNAALFDDISLAGHLKTGHLLSICPTNSQASQIIQ